MHDPSKLLHGEITGRIIGVFYDVYNELGSGYLEEIPHRAMCIALEAAGLRVIEKMPMRVWFRGQPIGLFYADLVVEGVVLVEVKSRRALEPRDEAQALNYLRCSDCEVGLLINFGAKAEYKRLVYENSRKVRPAVQIRRIDSTESV
jgi:GxxExxY protein